MSINRGSEWKKWDLHVHTPASILNNQFGDDWDIYVQTLFKKALEKNIVAIGITDYFSIEGYKKIKQIYLNDREKMLTIFSEEEVEKINNIFVFPNIEFRLKKFVGSSAINFHIIFSDKVSIEDIENNFLQLLTFIYSEDPSSGAETRNLTKENLILFGRRLQLEHTNFQDGSSALFTGTNNVKIDDLDIVSVLNSKKSIFNNKYFLALPSDEDLSDLAWDGQDHNDRKLLIQKSHFLLSGNPKTAQWGLGKFNTDAAEYINEFKSIKPTLWGSDSHDFDKLFEPDLHRYTWIKSDETFEGLRQVLHEPNRVKIIDTKPNSKNSYQTIEQIKLMDEGELFREQIIGLNQDLNSIIGGKSSGKSLLLYHLAKSILNHEKFEVISSIEGFQKYDDLPSFELEATWSDGHVSKLSNDSDKRPIVYIPQMYLNYMAEKKSRNEDFKQTIDDILKSNDGYSEYIDNKQNEILGYEQRIDSSLKDYFLQVEKLNSFQRDLQQLGDKQAIELNINNISEQLESLKSTSGFTEKEIGIYTSLNESNKVLSDKNSFLISKKELLTDLYNTSTQLQTKIPLFIEEEFSNVKYKYQNTELQTIIKRTIEQVTKQLNDSVTTFMSAHPFTYTEIDTEINTTNQQIISNNDSLAPLNEKIKHLEALKQKQKELEAEQAKVTAIDLKLNEIEIQKTRIDINNIINLYESLLSCYEDIVVKHEKFKAISDSIDLLSEISFNIDSFHRDFSDYITKNRTLQTIFSSHGFEANTFHFNKDEHIDNIKFICNTILEDTSSLITYNQGKQKQEIINALFKNYFIISYDLMQGSDRLGHMSPGKKGIILFQLFLHMSSSRDPILIDQPEDNLDNRTVYQELNDFIKEKKLQRQIIIVSHNSNLVVSTYSENIIVAHQNASSDDRPKFEYINGALENTFIDSEAEHILQQQGIREHVCEILEGGVEAFKKREQKYNI
ncbi:MAG: hypothetical protein L3I99_05990 [Sulfurimonas sp.]|nr:hypothetical protein [Sulfurimonas sp.]